MSKNTKGTKLKFLEGHTLDRTVTEVPEKAIERKKKASSARVRFYIRVFR